MYSWERMKCQKTRIQTSILSEQKSSKSSKEDNKEQKLVKEKTNVEQRKIKRAQVLKWSLLLEGFNKIYKSLGRLSMGWMGTRINIKNEKTDRTLYLPGMKKK